MDIDTTIIAFDLHGVVLTPVWSSIMRAIWEFNHKLSIFGVLFKPRMLWLSFKLLLNHPTDEEFFTIIDKYSPTLMPLAVSIMMAHQPIKKTVDILHRLKNIGYELHIVSNIGPRRYQHLCKQFPALIKLFSCAKINNGDGLAMIKKPNPQFYADYLAHCNPFHKDIVFVDNEKANITAACKFNIIGIHFTSPEYLELQLKAQLDIM